MRQGSHTTPGWLVQGILLLLAGATAIMAQTVVLFDPPNSKETDVMSINNTGEITGFFYDTSQGTDRGFLRDRDGNITVFDVPDSEWTAPLSINDNGDIAGNVAGNVSGGGFVRDRNGAITVFQVPNADTTQVSGINNNGDITGEADFGSRYRGFVRDVNGNFTVFDAVDYSVWTAALAINDAGYVAGQFYDSATDYPPSPPPTAEHRWRGFVRDPNGNITTFDAFPEAVWTQAISINKAGEIAGMAYDAQQRYYGFIRSANGNITVFDAPGATGTIPYSINNGGDITGFFNTMENTARAFIRDPNGEFIIFDVPNAQYTEGKAVNDTGDVAGIYADVWPNIHGFFRTGLDTTPPVTTASAQPSPNTYTWNNTPVVVTLSSTDNSGNSGVKQIQFQIGNTGWQTVAEGTTSVTISTEGTTTLTYYATDNAGNQESAKTVTVKIDKTAPVISGLPASGCTIRPPNHKLVQVATVSAADAVSGIASFTVTGTSSNPKKGRVVITGGPVQYSVQLQAEKGVTYTLTATASDLAGNVSTSQATCTVP